MNTHCFGIDENQQVVAFNVSTARNVWISRHPDRSRATKRQAIERATIAKGCERVLSDYAEPGTKIVPLFAKPNMFVVVS